MFFLGIICIFNPLSIFDNFEFSMYRNPAGLAILGTFKFGSIGMGLEAYKYGILVRLSVFVSSIPYCINTYRKIHSDLFTACNVKWLGVRGKDLQLIPEESYVPLKPRDLQIAKSLMSCSCCR